MVRSTACPDWAERLQAGESIIPPPIFPDQAAQALAVFKELRIVDAPGSPTFGESCAPWVFDLVACIFGSYDVESGRRLITEFFVLIPKKNAKSTIAAGIMMTALILNWRQSAEFTILAPTIEVAGNSFGPSRDMVQRDDELDALMHVQTHIKTITHRTSNATLKVVAADSQTVSGKKSVGTLVDELWLFGKVADAENMFREALGGLASRPEGFVVYLTTQSDEPPAGIFKQKLAYARDVRDGKVEDPAFVPVIFEHPPEMVASKEHLQLQNLRLVNPNWGYSVDQIYIEREFQKAQIEGDDSLRGFLAKHGNVEIGLALRSDRWAGAEFWEDAAGAPATLPELLSRCEVAVVGIDGGGLDDLLGLAVIGREEGTGRWLHWGRAWAHKIALKRRKDVAPRLLDFQRDGDLVIVDRPGQDIVEVADIVCQVRDAGLLPEERGIGVDAAGIGDIVDELAARDFDPEKDIVAVAQGWRLNGAIKTTERKIAGGELLHGGRPIMAWSVSNARIEDKGNAVSVTKQASGKAKIDPLMAVFDAVTLMALNPAAAGRSFWETEAA